MPWVPVIRLITINISWNLQKFFEKASILKMCSVDSFLVWHPISDLNAKFNTLCETCRVQVDFDTLYYKSRDLSRSHLFGNAGGYPVRIPSYPPPG